MWLLFCERIGLGAVDIDGPLPEGADPKTKLAILSARMDAQKARAVAFPPDEEPE